VSNTRSAASLAWRPSLFASGEPTVDAGFGRLTRTELAEGAWIDHQEGWVTGSGELFDRLVAAMPWDHPVVTMYGQRLDQPRLSARWPGADVDPVAGPFVEQLGELLSERYGLGLRSIGANLYRDGADSVAWHGDRIARELETSLVAIVSLGERRPFRLRPKTGGASRVWRLGEGDLFVMGGTCQRTWQHCVPKVSRPTGPRLSLTFRTAYDP
jgi:alkylated DNA repair dioxygenase AlkB